MFHPNQPHSSSGFYIRKGFTIVELLVVIFVVSILVAITVPAVQSARESARRLACSNNLKQVSLAISSYVSAVRTYPPGGNGGRGFSFLCMILPALDQLPIYNSINFSYAAFLPPSAVNSTAVHMPVAAFVCPSDRRPGGTLAITNYAGNGGTGYQRAGYDGVFAPGNYLTIGPQALTDGLSSTVMMSEWRAGSGTRSARPVFNTPLLDKPSQFEAFVQACAQAAGDGSTLQGSHKGNYWIQGDFGFSLYNHVMPIDGVSCLNGGFSTTGSWTAESQHPGGVYSAFADGHVQFVKATVAPGLWRAIATRAGAEATDGL